MRAMHRLHNRVAMGLASGVFAVAAVLVACDDDRGGDVPFIRAALEALPGVEVRDVVGWDSMWPLFGPMDIRAELNIRGGGRLVFCDLTPGAFDGSGQFILAQIGRWAPSAIAERDVTKVRRVAGCPASVDIGPDSAFVKLVPFRIRTVGDVVRNYDRLEAFVGSWPLQPTRVPASDGSGWIEYRKSEAQ